VIGRIATDFLEILAFLPAATGIWKLHFPKPNQALFNECLNGQKMKHGVGIPSGRNRKAKPCQGDQIICSNFISYYV
jgi:hypothetical protein